MHYDTETLERSASHECDEHPYGPFWLGRLHDTETLERMSPENTAAEKRCGKMLELWRGELDAEVFLFDLSELSSSQKLSPPRLEDMVAALSEHGRASRTHFSPTSFKTDLSVEEVVSVYRDVSPEARRNRS